MKIPKTNRKPEEVYFDHLYTLIRDEKSLELEDFIYELFSFPFVCHIPNDDNRVEDGLVLRKQYAEKQGFDNPEDILPGPCTVLEMLLALAGRMDFILFDPRKGDRYQKWFWLLISNLKLKKYHNGDEDSESKKKYNRIVLKKLVNREYKSDGRGGLFPLDDPSGNQREVEIWYQMMAFISQEYDI
jgi:hypothetical protein